MHWVIHEAVMQLQEWGEFEAVLSKNTCSGFCKTTAQWGNALSFTGEYSAGLPVVKQYDGSNFCGVTNSTVVSLDSPYAGAATQEGGKINIIQYGEIRIRDFLIVNFEKADFNKYIRPHKKGWKIQKKRTKKSVGVIYLVAESMVEVNLF